jgi:hypothetical protein
MQRYTIRNVMVCGCFSGKEGRGSLYFLLPKVTMNSHRCITMLKDKLLFWMRHHRAEHFFQDGASCHTSKKVVAFLKRTRSQCGLAR